MNLFERSPIRARNWLEKPLKTDEKKEP